MKESYSSEDALVLFSGGQDSTTCLFWAMKKFRRVEAVCFKYGQKHSVEVENSKEICAELNIKLKIVDISFLTDLVDSNLFEGRGDVNEKHSKNSSVPSSFVPYRNMIFLTLASAWAGTENISNLVTGVCETDSSGYADCRDVFIKSLETSLNLATDFEESNVVIHTPLMRLTKSETFKLAEELDCLDFILERTITCYNGVKIKHEYGYGCGECPACRLRKRGYESYLEEYR